MKHKLPQIIFLLMIVAMLIISRRYLPAFLSFQDPIDPDSIHDQIDTAHQTAYFNNKLVNVPPLPNLTDSSRVLGTTTTNKRIEVDLSTQKLRAYENDKQVFEYLISSGKWDRTPTGTFKIWAFIKSQKMSGGSKELGTYYYLPNVPYIMFFYNDKVPKKVGYSIHGTYWHNNFGVPMSHGCINMKTEEVASIYSWADYNTTITISGKYQTQLPSAQVNPSSKSKNL